MKLPMREKYLDEMTGGAWFIFGQHSDGSVDIVDLNRGIIEFLPRDIAEQVCELQNEFYKRLAVLLCT